MNEEKTSFETSFERLEEIVNKLNEESTSLEESIMLYEEGISYYKQCKALLENAKQKIETINRND